MSKSLKVLHDELLQKQDLSIMGKDSYLGLDDYSDLTFSEEEIQKLGRALQWMGHGSSSVGFSICKETCAWKSRCAYYQIGKHPIGRSCLVELNLYNQWRSAYIQDFQVLEDSFTELGMCSELAEIEIMLWRIKMTMAVHESNELVAEQAVGADRHGDTIYQRQVSPYYQVLEKLTQRKSRLVKLMVGDRQEKYKQASALRATPDHDPSVTMAELKAKMEKYLLDYKEQVKLPAPEEKVLSPEDLIG